METLRAESLEKTLRMVKLVTIATKPLLRKTESSWLIEQEIKKGIIDGGLWAQINLYQNLRIRDKKNRGDKNEITQWKKLAAVNPIFDGAVAEFSYKKDNSFWRAEEYYKTFVVLGRKRFYERNVLLTLYEHLLNAICKLLNWVA